mmetsp:Transcript_128512/g.363704  ORF Transcript_128512/g.363704 Transcript_128512/m.363704 type:complete len:226 (+) Transcript_128512:743-1420(+)
MPYALDRDGLTAEAVADEAAAQPPRREALLVGLHVPVREHVVQTVLPPERRRLVQQLRRLLDVALPGAQEAQAGGEVGPVLPAEGAGDALPQRVQALPLLRGEVAGDREVHVPRRVEGRVVRGERVLAEAAVLVSAVTLGPKLRGLPRADLVAVRWGRRRLRPRPRLHLRGTGAGERVEPPLEELDDDPADRREGDALQHPGAHDRRAGLLRGLPNAVVGAHRMH